MPKNNYVKYSITLGVICLLASGLLSVVFALTQPKMLEQQEKTEKSALSDVYPQADSFDAVEENGEVVYYKALDKDKQVMGVAFKAVKRGYASDIVTMVGMDTTGNIVRVKVLSQNETPGLGTRITEVQQKETVWDVAFKGAKPDPNLRPWFQVQFDGKSIEALDTQIQTITGATVTSRAMIDSIRETGRAILEKRSDG